MLCSASVPFVAEHFWYICLLGSLASFTDGSEPYVVSLNCQHTGWRTKCHTIDCARNTFLLLQKQRRPEKARKCSAAQGPHSEVVPRAF